MRVLLCAILLSLSFAVVSKELFAVGPWKIGDTREQVLSATQFGPYRPVSATGGLETRSGRFLNRKVTVSFVFDQSDRVEYIQVWLYEGPSYRKARKEALRVFDLFAEQFGGAWVPGVDVNDSPTLNRGDLEALLERVLGQAPKLGEKFRRERQIVATTALDLVPFRQPTNGKLTAQLVHTSRHRAFFVFVFFDRPSAPDRRVESNVQLEKL